MVYHKDLGASAAVSPASSPPVIESLVVLKTAEDLYRLMVELAREGMFILDAEARIIYANQCLAQMLGYRPEDLVGQPVFSFMDEEAGELMRAKLRRRQRGLSDVYELSLRRKDGTALAGLISATPLMEKGVFSGSLAVFTDISPLKEAEGKLRSAIAFRDTIINSITDHLIVIDPRNCQVVLTNESFLSRLGRSPREIIGKSCYEVMHRREGPCQEEGIYCPVQETARLKRTVLSDKSFANAQGQERIFQIATYPHFDKDGQVDLVVCLERDVTDRRKMEETLAFRSRELQKTQLQLEKLFEISRERISKRSIPELVHFLHSKICETFLDSDAVFLILDGNKNILPLDECPSQITEPLRRVLRRWEQNGVLPEFIEYLVTVSGPQVITSTDRTPLPGFLRVISSVYQSWIGLPIFAKQDCIGFFLLCSHSHQSYSREDLHFFHALFAQVGCYLRYLVRQDKEKGLATPDQPEKFAHGEIIGRSKPMQEVYQLIDLVSGTDATVLITGENGTGKELVARTIHRQSKRSRGPFVVANCSAYSPTLLESELFGHEKGAFTGAIRRKKGRFELAQGGTLFLDEIGDIPPATQVLLLRFLQDHCFERVGGEVTIETDVRVLAATNKDLYKEVQSGRFRDDLYYRLNVITIQLPALRERREDIPLLSQHFLNKYNLKEGKKISRFSPDAMQALMDYEWPGNVRQLENAISHAVILAQGEIIRRRHLPRFLKESGEEVFPTSLAETEKRLIQRVLKEANWNKHEAAKRLRVSRSTLYSKIKRYAISQMDLE
jgi:PAS domain S-box-containing protein|uniref:PAS domain S-box protein n=1 Tax=Desulfobacca acetoxidans TaxID=60893 RepID=A0A7C3SLL6_9BACT